MKMKALPTAIAMSCLCWTLFPINASAQVTDEQFEALKEKVQSIEFFGFVRAKYDADDEDGIGADSNNKHFYMDFEGKMKVSDQWDAHFQSETRKGYTVNQTWRGENNQGSDDQDGTFQRIWVEGSINDVNVVVGTKWWGLGFQNVPFGHAADGISLDYNFVPTWNAKAFWLRPRQGDLISMPNGSNTQIAGVNLTGVVYGPLSASFTYATNDNHDDEQMMDNMGAAELQYQPNDDWLFKAAYVQTDADDYDTSQEYRVDYKGPVMDQLYSWGVYLRLFDFERFGDYSHDDEWASLPADTKGWILGVRFVPFKNVVWETFYSVQKRNRALDPSDPYYKRNRDLFRTQLDFHF